MRKCTIRVAQTTLKKPNQAQASTKVKNEKQGSGLSTEALLPIENGGYLLSHLRSTIGVIGLNCSVRNGKRWNPDAIATLISLGITPVIMLLLQTGKSRDRAT